MYVDKFKDTETSHREIVGQIQIAGGNLENLVFWTERSSDKKIREASLIRETDASEKAIPNVTYDLLAPELESAILSAGFKSFEKISLKSENTFDIWLAKK
jgi:hypothetical protein